MFAKFTRDEWVALSNKAKADYFNTLGEIPTKRQVASKLPNLKRLGFWMIVGIILVAIYILFSSFKLALQGIPFTESMVEILGHGEKLDDWLVSTLTLLGVLSFGSLAGFGIMFYMRLAQDPEIHHLQQETANYTFWQKFSLSYISPRLPTVLVYIITLWLWSASSQIEGSWFEQYTPILAEIALIHLVNELNKQGEHNSKIIEAAYKEAVARYNNMKDNYVEQPEYLSTLHSMGIEKLSNLTRPDPETNRNHKPNKWMETDEDTLSKAFEEEFARFTVQAQKFVTTAIGLLKEAKVFNSEQRGDDGGTKRFPPNGASEWTPQTLKLDIEQRGIDLTNYTRPQLDNDYASGYNARPCFAQIKAT